MPSNNIREVFCKDFTEGSRRSNEAVIAYFPRLHMEYHLTSTTHLEGLLVVTKQCLYWAFKDMQSYLFGASDEQLLGDLGNCGERRTKLGIPIVRFRVEAEHIVDDLPITFRFSEQQLQVAFVMLLCVAATLLCLSQAFGRIVACILSFLRKTRESKAKRMLRCE